MLPILRQNKGGNYLVLQIETQTLNLMRAPWTVTTSEEGEKRFEERWAASARLLTEKNFRKNVAIGIYGRWPQSWAANL